VLKPVSAKLLTSSKGWLNTIVTNMLKVANNTIQHPAKIMDISPLVVEVGDDLVFKLLFNTQWSIVIKSVNLISK